MNRIRTVLILLIFAFLAWTLLPKTKSDHVEIPPKQISNIKTSSPNPVETKKPLAPAPLVQALPTKRGSTPEQNSQEREKPPPNAVPFELVNGWVVAYGDILIGKPTRPDLPSSGYIEAPQVQYWKKATIPFSLHESLPNPERVLRAIAYMNANTPVRFVPYDGQPDNIVFAPMDGICMSYLGKLGGNQPIYLDANCGESEILHEILHALGFIHEHSRLDRDLYVGVNWDNIQPDKQRQFMIVPESLRDPLNQRPFDYNSIMLYSPDIFAMDRSIPTLQSKTGTEISPVRSGLSAEDIARLIHLYGGR